MRYSYNIEPLARRQAEEGLTYEGLGQKTGLRGNTIRNALMGRACNPPTIKKIADALGVPMAELVVPVEAEPQPKNQTPEESAA